MEDDERHDEEDNVTRTSSKSRSDDEPRAKKRRKQSNPVRYGQTTTSSQPLSYICGDGEYPEGMDGSSGLVGGDDHDDGGGDDEAGGGPEDEEDDEEDESMMEDQESGYLHHSTSLTSPVACTVRGSENCSNSPLRSPNFRKNFQSSLSIHSHHQQHSIHSNHHVSTTQATTINNPPSSISPDHHHVNIGSVKDFANLLSFQVDGVLNSQEDEDDGPEPSQHSPSLEGESSPPEGSTTPPGYAGHLHPHNSNNNNKSKQQQHHQQSSQQHSQETKGNSNPIPMVMFPNQIVPYLFPVIGPAGSAGPGGGGSGGPAGNGGPGSGARHNGQVNPSVNPVSVQKIFNPEAYCELCNKELCNKYFLKTHKANKHGIYTSDSGPGNPGTAAAASAAAAAAAVAVNATFSANVNAAAAAAAAYFQTELSAAAAASGSPAAAAAATSAALQMQHLLQQATASVNGAGGGATGPGSGNSAGTAGSVGPSDIASQAAAAAVALQARSIRDMESYCDKCQKQFCNKYFLKKHRQKIHGITPNSGPGSGVSSADQQINSQSQASNQSATNDGHRTYHNRSVSPAGSAGGGGSGLNHCPPGLSASCKPLLPSPRLSPLSSTPGDANSQSPPATPTATSLQALSTTINLVSSSQQQSSSTKHSSTVTRKTPSPGGTQAAAVAGSTPSPQPAHVASSPPSTAASAGGAVISTSSDTYCDLCRVDLPNPMALQAHRTVMHGLPFSLPASFTREKWQAMMASLQAAESFAMLTGSQAGGMNVGRQIHFPASGSSSSGDENIIFTPEKLREMGVINADAFCEICRKEFCNKYFLRTHKLNKHGIGTADTASNCGSTRSVNSHHGIGSERQSSCNEDNTVSPRSCSDDSNPLELTGRDDHHINNNNNNNSVNNNNNNNNNMSTGNCESEEMFPCDVCGHSFASIQFLHWHKLYAHELTGFKKDDLAKTLASIPGSSSPPGESDHHNGPTSRRGGESSSSCEVSAGGHRNSGKQNNNNHQQQQQSSDHQASQDLDKLQTLISGLNPCHPSTNASKSSSPSPPSSSSQASKATCALCRQEFENSHFLRVHMVKDHELSPSDETLDTFRQIFDNSRLVFPSLMTSAQQQHPSNGLNQNSGSSNPLPPPPNSSGHHHHPNSHHHHHHHLSHHSSDPSDLYCDLCGKFFQNKSSLRTHRINIHGSNENGSSRQSSSSTTISTTFASGNLRPSLGEGKSSSSSTTTITTTTIDQGINSNQSKISNRQAMSSGVNARTHSLSSSGIGGGGGSVVPPYEGKSSSKPATGRNYCNLCNKELCNKYFMKTHMLKMHNINIDEQPREAAGTSTIGGVTCDICQKELCSKYFLKVHKQNTHGRLGEHSAGSAGSSRNSAAVAAAAGLLAGSSNSGLMTVTPGGGGDHGESSSGLMMTSNPVEDRDMSESSSSSQHAQGIDPSDTSNRYFTHYTEVCPFCDRRFKSIKWLKTHMLTHNLNTTSSQERISDHQNSMAGRIPSENSALLSVGPAVGSTGDPDDSLMIQSVPVDRENSPPSSASSSPNQEAMGIDPSDTSHPYYNHYTEICPLCEKRFRSIKWLKTHLLVHKQQQQQQQSSNLSNQSDHHSIPSSVATPGGGQVKSETGSENISSSSTVRGMHVTTSGDGEKGSPCQQQQQQQVDEDDDDGDDDEDAKGMDLSDTRENRYFRQNSGLLGGSSVRQQQPASETNDDAAVDETTTTPSGETSGRETGSADHANRSSRSPSPSQKGKGIEQLNEDDDSDYFNHYTEVCPLCERRFESSKWLKTNILLDRMRSIFTQKSKSNQN